MPVNWLGGGRLWQFANRSHLQMMAYLLENPDMLLAVLEELVAYAEKREAHILSSSGSQKCVQSVMPAMIFGRIIKIHRVV